MHLNYQNIFQIIIVAPTLQLDLLAFSNPKGYGVAFEPLSKSLCLETSVLVFSY